MHELRKPYSTRRRSRGAVLVEYVFMVPFMLGFVVVLLIGFAFGMDNIRAAEAAGLGARIAATTSSNSAVESAVGERVGERLVDVSVRPRRRKAGSMATVEVAIANSFLGLGWRVSSSASALVEPRVE